MSMMGPPISRAGPVGLSAGSNAMMANAMTGVGSGLLSSIGQFVANRQNKREARKNREFQAYMSNTAIQRRMEDMKKAGINPILAARFDASTPSGALATMENVGKTGVEGAAQGISSALSMTRQRQELKNMEAAEAATRADAANKHASTASLNARSRLVNYQADLVEGAALAAQTFLTYLPGKNPREIRAWIDETARDLWSKYGDNAKGLWQWIKDFGDMIQSLMPGSGLDHDRNNALRERDQAYANYLDWYETQRNPIQGRRQKRMNRDEFFKSNWQRWK